ncbi:MAG: DoxX family protein [Opitutae bacterium]|nr:DoxX family protein [Opitutae bacterium]
MKPTQYTNGAPVAPFSRRIPAIVRILMGLPLVVFGLNLFLNFIPPPPTPLPAGAAAFAGALAQTGYMMPLIGVTLLIVGVMLLTNRFVPLALALFAPFILNSVAFHLFLERSGMIMAGVFLIMELYLAWVYRRAYASMLAAKVTL